MQTASDTRSRIARLITTTVGANLTAEDLENAERLDDLVAFDSIALLEFVVGLEQEFSIQFDQDQFTRDFVLDLPALVQRIEKLREGPRE